MDVFELGVVSFPDYTLVHYTDSVKKHYTDNAKSFFRAGDPGRRFYDEGRTEGSEGKEPQVQKTNCHRYEFGDDQGEPV